MGNLLVEGIKSAIHAAKAHLRYLLPYSPEFSPIEHAWPKIMTYLRQAGASTVDSLQQALVKTIYIIMPADIRN